MVREHGRTRRMQVAGVDGAIPTFCPLITATAGHTNRTPEYALIIPTSETILHPCARVPTEHTIAPLTAKSTPSKCMENVMKHLFKLKSSKYMMVKAHMKFQSGQSSYSFLVSL